MQHTHMYARILLCFHFGPLAHHITSHRIASHHIASHHITSHHIASHRIASHHIASHHIASHRIASHRITSDPIVSHQSKGPHRTAPHELLFSALLIEWACFGHKPCEHITSPQRLQQQQQHRPTCVCVAR